MIDKIGLLPTASASSLAKPSTGATQLVKNFGDYLNDALTSISAQQAKVDSLNADFAAGDTADVHQLMIESEKAAIGLELTVQVRNKVIEAYQEIMRMQV